MPPFCRWLLPAWRVARYVACWIILGFVLYFCIKEAWSWYGEPHLDAGTRGHANVDFGGQWFAGKLILNGQGHDLYERHRQWQVFQDNFPLEREPLTNLRIDTFRLQDWQNDRHRNRSEYDSGAVELLASYLTPLGAEHPFAAAGAAIGADLCERENREWFDNGSASPYGQRFAADMLGWLCGRDDSNDARTRASCLAPFMGQDALTAAVLFAAGEEHVWTKKAIANASKRRVGGQVYPPLHAFLYAPFALFEPHVSYRIGMIAPIVLAFLAGWGLKLITHGSLWWPVATLLCVAVPGWHDAMTLGHNGSFIVLFLVWGYYLLQQDWDFAGGAVWGLFAYKPSWAVTYFLMLVATRRWRAAFGMGLCAAAQILLSLPFVGVQSWQEWREVVKEASDGYGEYKNWVGHSRDMFSIPRRLMNDFSLPVGERDHPHAIVIGWVLLGFVLTATVVLTTLRIRRDKRWSHAGAAFVLLGFWMCTYHITYYDTMFATLPLALLMCVPGHLLAPCFFRRARLAWRGPRAIDGETLELTPGPYGTICNPLIVYLLPIIIWNPILTYFDPKWWDMHLIVPCFALLWAWAGYLWLREGAAQRSLAA